MNDPPWKIGPNRRQNGWIRPESSCNPDQSGRTIQHWKNAARMWNRQSKLNTKKRKKKITLRAALNRRWRARNVLGVHHVDFSFTSVHLVKMDVFRLNRTDEVLEPDLIATQLALYNLSLITWRGKPARHRQWTWFNKTLNHRYLACELLSTVWVAHLHLQNGLRPAVWDRFRFPALPQCRSESVQSSFSAFFFFFFFFFFFGFFQVVIS